MEVKVTWSPDARAALLRDESGEIVGTTWGGTVCWFPRKPRKFVAVEKDSGDETILRCGFCAGCRELERQWLCERLREKYQDVEEELWLIIVEAPLSRHAFISRSLLRRKSLKLERASYRLGSDSSVFLARGMKPAMWELRGFRYKVAVHRIRKTRGKRAWALLTAGMLKPRDDYGQWTNRFYHRGLPPRAREFHFAVATRGGISTRHQTSRYARAWRNGVAIEPPVAWKLPRLNRRKGPERRRPAHASSVDEILTQIFERAAGCTGARIPLTTAVAVAAAPNSVRLSERSASASRATLRGGAMLPSGATSTLQDRTLILNKGSGYRGSVQSAGAFAGAWAERMKLIARKREGPGDG